MIKFTPLGGHIGADVHGIDLSQPLKPDDVAAIREGVFEHLALFFRKQKLLTFEQHKALASNFGELETTTYRRQDRDGVRNRSPAAALSITGSRWRWRRL